MEVSGRTDQRSFKDTIGKSSAEADEVFCQPCSSDEDWVVAVGFCQNCNEYFCAACLKPHRKQSVSRHHVILEGEHMPKPQMSKVQLDPCAEPCAQHTNKIVKFYCSSHDTVGCSDCMVLNHKTCNVDRIQDISSNYYNSQEHTELTGKVDKFLNYLDKLKEQIQTKEHYTNETHSKAVKDIKAFRKEVNDYLDKVEAEILAEVNKRKQTDEHTMSKLKAEKQFLQNEIQQLDEKLNQQSNKANELFVAAKKMKKKLSSLDASIKQNFQDSQVKLYRFEPSPEVRRIIASKVRLGKLVENLHMNRRHKKIEDMIPQFEAEINVRAPEEKQCCYLIASAIISPTQIVLADFENKSVKLVDIEQKKLLARYNLNTPPTDVARFNENTVAVALPDEQKIQLLSITPSYKLTLEQEIKVNCYSKVLRLFCEKDRIIIAKNGKVEVLNTSGDIVKEITFPDITWPTSIASACDFDSFYVSNHIYQGKPTAIYKWNYDGSLVATYKDENLPDVRKLTITRDGTLFACNWSEPGSIHVVYPECKKIKEILQDNEHIRRPYCVSYCSVTNKLFVCNYLGKNSTDKLNYTMKIFKMN